MNRTVNKHLAQVGEGMTLLDEDEIQAAIGIVGLVKRYTGTLYVFGNGGSHSTVSHFAQDLMKQTHTKAICLGDAVPVVSAYGNDDGHENMYIKPLGTLLHPNDAVLGISCGGSSENVVRALAYACKREDVMTIGMTGLGNETPINKIGLDALIHARVPDIRVQEDLHSIVCHAIVRALQEEQ